MRLERAPIVRHRPPGDAWWRVDLPELEALVDGGSHVAAERLAAGILRELDGTRGCGPRFGRGCSDSLGPLEACDACRRVDDAMAKVQMVAARARLNAALSGLRPYGASAGGRPTRPSRSRR